MKAYVLAGFLFAGLAMNAADAQTRWCSMKRVEGKLDYPPIGRAAHVSGVVISRVVFRPTGEVVAVERISGPVILSDSVEKQLRTWTISAEAIGEELCQSLVVSTFALDEPKDDAPQQLISEPSVFRTSVNSFSIVISDPAGCLRIKRRWLRPTAWFRHCD